MTSTADECWWWLSFANPSAARGRQFRGVCVVRGSDLVTAAERAHVLGINPGGQIRGHALTNNREPPEALREKLVTNRDELERIAQEWTGKGVSSW